MSGSFNDLCLYLKAIEDLTKELELKPVAALSFVSWTHEVDHIKSRSSSPQPHHQSRTVSSPSFSVKEIMISVQDDSHV